MTPHDRAAEGEGMVVPEHRRTVELPCGAVGAWDNTGYRCGKCLAIYGSIGCPCTPPKPQPVTGEAPSLDLATIIEEDRKTR